MVEAVPNRVREQRLARGLTQAVLAERANLTRQSVNAIEAGRSSPSVDVALRVAAALDTNVEALFSESAGDETLTAEMESTVGAARVAVARVGGRWIARELGGDAARSAADGIVVRTQKRRATVSLLRHRGEVAENVFLVGCATGLGVLADRLNSRPGPGRFHWIAGSSARALDGLARGSCHLAGVHLGSSLAKEANLVDARDALGKRPFGLVSLGVWKQGLVTRRGGPGSAAGLDEIVQKRFRLVVRELGSGARRLLDRALERMGTNVEIVARAAGLTRPIEVESHLELARAVAMGFGDAGVASQEVADAFGLTFLPLAEERYDLVLPLDFINDSRAKRLFDVLASGAFRRDLGALGYDARESGAQLS